MPQSKDIFFTSPNIHNKKTKQDYFFPHSIPIIHNTYSLAVQGTIAVHALFISTSLLVYNQR